MEFWLITSALAAITLLLALALGRRRGESAVRTNELRGTFGEEYDRVVGEAGRKKGEAILEQRRAKVESVDTSNVAPAQRAVFTERWHEIQHNFIDSPRLAVRDADILLVDVMKDRGLPAGSINDRTAAISLEAPDMAGSFHAAHELFVEIETDEDADRSVAEYRNAVITYRSLFELFLDRPAGEQGDRVDLQQSSASPTL